jgi:DNA damage-binding protein 1
MSYIVPIHRPSGVRHAIKLNFLSPAEEAVVIAKANRLEVYAQSPTEGLTLLYSKSVYGYITMLERLSPPSTSRTKTDHLFIGTDRYQYFTCSWDPETKQLRTEQSYVDQADKVLRDSREMDRCHIDPSRRYMTLELYDGTVTVIPIGGKKDERGAVGKRVKRESTTSRSSISVAGEQAGQSGLGEPVQVRIEELQTRSSCFMEQEGKSNPKLAMLWEDNDDRPQLKIRELKYYPSVSGDAASVELDTIHELREELDPGVSHLIPVSSPWGGCLVLGEKSIVYVDEQLEGVIRQDFGDEATMWRCWEKVDDKRWLLADEYGRLYFLMIEIEKGAVVSWKLDHVGMISQATQLIYLDEGIVFVGSHSGNSQVIRLQEEGLDVLQTFDNIAPIIDFNIMDLGRGSDGAAANEFSSGQARIVTASGAWQDGSIRSVRSGVGMEELGTVGKLSHITDLWALNSKGAEGIHDMLLVTFVDETRILKFDSEAAVEEVESFCGLELTQATLFASNLPDNKLLQVHEAGVVIADLESGMSMSQWKPTDAEAKITSAAANSVHLLVVEGGHTLHLFHLSDTNNFGPSASKTFSHDSQISSVTLPTSRSSACVVSFWQTASIAILDLHSLQPEHTQTLGIPGITIPRSILVADISPDAPPTLFISMADGTVVTYTFDPVQNTLSNQSRIILGSEPVFFKTLPRTDSDAGLSNIFASCEQPSLIYSDEGRIVYSAVNAEKSSRVCHFNTAAYPNAIAIATPHELKLAEIGSERTTQLQTLPIGETVRCLSYVPEKKLFGMGCIRRILEGETEALLSSVKIADEVTFRELDSVELLDGELVECIISSGSFEGEDGQEYGDMFIVGTSLSQDSTDGLEVMRGRIILYEVIDGKKIRKVTVLSVKGACRSLAMCDGKIVAGLVKTVCPPFCTSRVYTNISSGRDLRPPPICPIPKILPHDLHPHQTRHLPHLHQSPQSLHLPPHRHHPRDNCSRRPHEVPLNPRTHLSHILQPLHLNLYPCLQRLAPHRRRPPLRLHLVQRRYGHLPQRMAPR